MAEDFLLVSVDGIDDIAERLNKIPEAAGDSGVEEAGAYLLNVMRTYPPKRYVSRKAAYGVTFFSDKQRRFFFAALRDGRITVPYRRTQRLALGWQWIGSGRTGFLANETPYADLVMGDGQSRHAAKIGWKKVDDILKQRAAKILEQFEVGVKKALKKLRLV